MWPVVFQAHESVMIQWLKRVLRLIGKSNLTFL
jgi:hypothetical protein